MTKGADINAKDIIYLNLKIFFLNNSKWIKICSFDINIFPISVELLAAAI